MSDIVNTGDQPTALLLLGGMLFAALLWYWLGRWN